MRNYPVDSTEAMARIVALALLADGALDHSEVAALEKHELRENLDLPADTLERVIHEFCNDLMQTARAPNIGQIELDVQLVDHLLDDIQSPELQKKALTAIVDIVNADGSRQRGFRFSSSRSSFFGEYAITIRDENDNPINYNLNDFVTQVTVVESSECQGGSFATTGSGNGNLIIDIYRADGSQRECKFHFITFQP